MKIFLLLFFIILAILYSNKSIINVAHAQNASVALKVIFSDDFTGTTIDTSKWVPTSGWSQNNVLTVNGGGIGYTKESDFHNFTLNADFQIMPHNGYEYAAFILRQVPNNPFVGTYYLVQVGSKTAFTTPNEIRIHRGIDLVTTIPITFDINTGTWYSFKVTVHNYDFGFYIDNQFIGEFKDSSPFTTGGDRMRRIGAIGINAAGIPGDPLSDFVNYDNLVITRSFH